MGRERRRPAAVEAALEGGPDATSGTADEARRSLLTLDDGTVVGSIANAFADEKDGFTLRLSVTLPETAAPEVIQQHLEHFAVEYRNWIVQAAAEQQR